MKTTTFLFVASFILAVAVSNTAQAQSSDAFNAYISSSTNNSCFGYCNGTATVTANGGTLPYSYLWMPDGDTTSTDSNMCAGTYTVMVTDSAGIDTTYAYIIITQPVQMLIAIDSLKNVTCPGDCNGSATVSVIGGIPPYTYLWLPGGDTTNTDSNLCAGGYQVIVTDSTGCSAAKIIPIRSRSTLTASTAVTNVSCFGMFNGTATTTATGGTAPYQYLLTPVGDTTPVATGLPAGAYASTVTDSVGCAVSDSVTVAQPTVLNLNAYSVLTYAYAIASGGTAPYTYTWYPGGSTSSLVTGLSAGTYTVTVNDSNFCSDSVIITLTSTITIPKTFPYPRWSKRGVWLNYAAHYYNPDSMSVFGTPFVTYCRNNHITYVNLDGVENNPTINPIGPFYLSSAFVDPVYAVYLENFIDSLKTRGGVEQVGVVCYDTTIAKYDSNSYAIENFDVGNFTESVRMYNIGIPWNKKVDVLSLDEEFWAYSDSTDFFQAHVPMLQSMYKAAHECDANFLRVEDYIYEPMNPNNTSFNVNDPLELREADSISKYADRIINSCYTAYPQVLWNQINFMMAYPHFGSNPNKNIEIWPAFGSENQNDASCLICDEPGSGDCLGDSMCYHHETPDYMEQRYFDSLSYDENHVPKAFISYNGNTNQYLSVNMGADTNFLILGNLWYQYECLQNFDFDTNTNTGAIPFYVTLGPDTIWTGIDRTLLATTHIKSGGIVLGYIWYNLNTGARDSVLGASLSNTYTATFPARYGVITIGIIGSDTVTAIDYMNLYDDTCAATAIASIPLSNVDFKIYPNPSTGVFTIQTINDYRGLMHLYVYNMIGEEIKSEEIKGATNLINLSEQSSGVYFCRITDENGKLLKAAKIMVLY